MKKFIIVTTILSCLLLATQASISNKNEAEGFPPKRELKILQKIDILDLDTKPLVKVKYTIDAETEMYVDGIRVYELPEKPMEVIELKVDRNVKHVILIKFRSIATPNNKK